MHLFWFRENLEEIKTWIVLFLKSDNEETAWKLLAQDLNIEVEKAKSWYMLDKKDNLENTKEGSIATIFFESKLSIR